MYVLNFSAEYFIKFYINKLPSVYLRMPLINDIHVCMLRNNCSATGDTGPSNTTAQVTV